MKAVETLIISDNQHMTYGSLFSGIEGFGAGLDAAGMRCAWQVERDKDALRVLQKHYPDVPRFADVRGFNGASIPLRPDLICGGFPCQDLSVAGRRAGLAGKRSGLFFEFARIVYDFAPRWILVENVPGLLNSNGGLDFAAVLEAFTGCCYQVPAEGWRSWGIATGPLYGIAWRVLDAQWFGVAQRRHRVFLVGYLGDHRRAAEVLFERDCLPWDSPQSRRAWPDIAAAVRSRSARARGVSRPGRGGEDDVNLVVGPLTAGIGKGPRGTEMLDSNQLVRSALDASDGGADVKHAQGGRLVAYRTSPNCGAWETGDRTDALTTSTDPASHIVTHALTSEGHDASEDGTGRGTPLVVVPVEQPASGQGNGRVQSGRDDSEAAAGSQGREQPEGSVSSEPCSRPAAREEVSDTLAAPQAYQCHGSNVGPMGTLRRGNGSTTGGVPFVIQDCAREDERQNGSGISEEGIAYTLDGQGSQAIAFDTTQITSAENRSNPQPGDPCHPLAAQAHPPAIAFDERRREEGRQLEEQEDLAFCLESGTHQKGGGRHQNVSNGMMVRRLMPVETLRLQGFSDDYLDLDPPLSDSAKYRLTGNAVCKNVSEWIGHRIAALERRD